jgi:GH35 family endo-1,4-beta-xylanase
MTERMSRREFGRRSSALAAAVAGAALSTQTACQLFTGGKPKAAAPPPAPRKGLRQGTGKATGRSLRVLLLDAEGKPMDEGRRKTVYVANLHFEPERQNLTLSPDGAVEVAATLPRAAIHAKIAVPGFGDTWVIADNEGQGYAPGSATLDLVLEAARSRLADVQRLMQSSKAPFSPECLAHRDAAIENLAPAKKAPGTTAARHNLAALSHGLWAGELAVVENARHVIAHSRARRDFLFGCNAFKYRPDSPYATYFREALNYATLPFYLSSLEREEGKPDYARIDQILAWCEKIGIRPKGHPLWWGHEAGIPKWLAGADWPEARRQCVRVVGRSVERYRGRINYWDVINEAHDWANGLNLTHDQEIEITRVCCDTARSKNPAATIVVNNCCPFGENAAQGRVHKGPIYDRVFTPLAYLDALMQAGVEFDIVGVQIYFPARDMMAIGKLLDEYARFGKPVHVTELGVRSESGRPAATAEWHEPWCEKVQADWMEWFYTMAYARPDVRAITWWDFSDPAFIGSSGFLREDQTPREMFFRLKALQRSWRLTA